MSLQEAQAWEAAEAAVPSTPTAAATTDSFMAATTMAVAVAAAARITRSRLAYGIGCFKRLWLCRPKMMI